MINIEIGQKTAMDAVYFFSMSAPDQTKNLTNFDAVKPWFFSQDWDGNNYFYGIGCIFITYLPFLWDVINNDADERALEELHAILSMLLRPEYQAEWRRDAFHESPIWRVVRMVAKNNSFLIDKRGNELLGQFEIDKLINIDDFTSLVEGVL